MPADHGTPTGGDERRAEIEAVARAEVEAGVAVLRAMLGDILGTDEEVHDMALGVLLGAARVRDARNDDERPAGEGGSRMSSWSDLSDVDHEAMARSPQGEDHEAGKLAAALTRIEELEAENARLKERCEQFIAQIAYPER